MKKVIDRYNSLSVNIRAAIWFAFATFFQKGMNIIATPIFTRLMTTEEYGSYSVYNSWMNIIAIIITMNLSAGLYTQGLIKFEERKDEFSSSMQGLTISLVGFWLLIYLLGRSFFEQVLSLNTYQMIAMFITIWTSAIYTFWSINERVAVRYKKLLVLTIVSSLFQPLLGVLFIIAGVNGINARIMGTVITNVVCYLGLFINQLRQGKMFYDKFFWVYAFRFNIVLLPHYLSSIILASADRIMIDRLASSSAAGKYSLAYSIAALMIIFNTAILQSIEPWMYKQIRNHKILNIRKVAYVSFGVIAALNLCLIALAPEIIMIFAPSNYYEAIYAIPPIAMSSYFIFLYTFFAVFELYLEKTWLASVATVSGATLNIVLNYILIPKFGFIAAGYTTLVCYVLYSLLHYVFSRYLCENILMEQYPYQLHMLVLISSIFLGSGFLIGYLYNYFVIRYIVIMLVVGVVILKRKYILNFVFLLKRGGKVE